MFKRSWLILVVVLALAGCATSPERQMTEAQRQKASTTNTQLAVQYMQQEDLQRALNKLEKALRQNPDNGEAHMVMAVLQERLDQPEKAREYYEEALGMIPENSSLLNNYGRFLCGEGDYERGEELFRRAANNPLYETPEVPWTNAGVCALRQDDRQEAEDFFLKALRANERFSRALYQMARLRYEDGKYMSARGFYQRYTAVAEQDPESLWLGVRIENELGNEDAVASYSLLLRQKFPDSEQTRQLLEWQENEG